MGLFLLALWIGAHKQMFFQVHFLFSQTVSSLETPGPSIAPFSFLLLAILNGGSVFKRNEKSQLHRKQNGTGCNTFPLYHHLSLLCPLAGWARGWRGWGDFWHVCWRWLVVDLPAPLFSLSTSKNNISEAYLKVIVALSHLLPSKTLLHTGGLRDWKHFRHPAQCIQTHWERNEGTFKSQQIVTHQLYNTLVLLTCKHHSWNLL